MNFCGPVVEELEDVVGVEDRRWGNVSAFYEKGGRTYSIGYVRCCTSVRSEGADGE